MKKKKASVYSLKISPHKILINYKGGKGNFAMDKSDRHHLIQGVKVSISRNEMYGHHVPPGVMCREENIPAGGFLEVQWSRLHTPTGGGVGSVPGQGSNILQINLENHFCRHLCQKCKTLVLFWKSTRHTQGEEHSAEQLGTALQKCCDQERQSLRELSQTGGG